MKKSDNRPFTIVVVSGKGGTGKTTVTAALSILAENIVVCDADVDAANLHLILKPQVIESRDFFGIKLASIDESLCTGCGECLDACRYDAIVPDPIRVVESFCEGCAACFHVCPVNAVTMKPHQAGELYISRIASHSDGRTDIPMIHARLGIAEDNSGLLVSEVRKSADEMAETDHLETILIDGPPGIGCPVIASLTGSNLALVVTEPTVSGVSDLERILELCGHFRIPTRIIINKCDINEELCRTIERVAEDAGGKVIGRIPYDERVIESISRKTTVIEAGPESIAREIRSVWDRVTGEIAEMR
ncbi:MAG: 4Fe-4S binding protein [Deltaproteobacteria bacterium]|nr:4Fe-4S binding protein [Candidatus Zymogenaceae bacterium]